MSEERFLVDRYRQRIRQEASGPVRQIGQLLRQLLARRNYGRLLSQEQLVELWCQVVEEQLARSSRPGSLRQGLLTVWVTDSVVLQELTFHKRQIVARINILAPQWAIRDLEFRVNPVLGNLEQP